MKFLPIFFSVLVVLVSSSLADTNESGLIYALSFDGDITPTVSAEKSRTRTIGGGQPEFVEGIAGQGLLTGADKTGLLVDALDNISPKQGTISVWLKGLENADWNTGPYFEPFWVLSGENGGSLNFYHYMKETAPWLYGRRDSTKDYSKTILPTVPEQEWHNWVFTWSEEGGAFLYLDGSLVGPSAAVPPPAIRYIQIGQPQHPYSPPEHNKVIDEFRIYDHPLDAGQIAAEYWRLAKRPMRSTLSVSPSSQSIEVDGRMNEAEWSGAAGYAGLVDAESRQLSAQPTWGKISYDTDNVYFIVHSENPPKVRQNLDATVLHGTVKREATKHDGDVEADDHFAIRLQPLHDGDQAVYTILVNGIDVVYDARDHDTSWESQVSTKSSAEVDGWTMEVKLPLKSMGIEKITPGTKWNFNVERVWHQLRQGRDIWEPIGWGTLEFASSEQVRADLTRFDIAKTGAVDAGIDLYNPSDSTQAVSLVLDANGRVLHEEEVSLSANEKRTVSISGISGGNNGELITVTAQVGDRVLLRRAAPLVLESIGHIQLWKYPSLHQIRIGWELFTDASPQSLQLDVEFRDKRGKTVRQIQRKSLDSLSGSVIEDVKDLQDGSYVLVVKIGDGERTLQEDTILYDKLPLPSWLGNQLGISDTPPSPWTDIIVEQKIDAVSVWGRVYKYGNALLPAQIVNQGKEMLAEPMRFHVKQGDKTYQSSSSSANAKWTKVGAVRADSSRSQGIGNIELHNTSYIEYDGMVWNEFEVRPQGTTEIDELILEIPLRQEWTELLKPYNDYRLQETGRLPKEGWKGGASTMPWLGNGDGGFQVFQEATATWVGSRVTEIVPRSEGGAVLRVHIIDETVELSSPLKFSLGWMASPV